MLSKSSKTRIFYSRCQIYLIGFIGIIIGVFAAYMFNLLNY